MIYYRTYALRVINPKGPLVGIIDYRFIGITDYNL